MAREDWLDASASSMARALVADRSVDTESVARAARAAYEALTSGGKLLVCGNGGSAADAQHFAAEFVGRFERDRRALPAIALTTDTSAITAIANDYGYEHVFSRQVEALGAPSDVLFAISTSGESESVLNAARVARGLGLVTVALVGAAATPLGRLVDVSIAATGESTARIQETFLIIEHTICGLVEAAAANEAARRAASPSRVLPEDELVRRRRAWAAAGKTVVWTNGCFDLFHFGHLSSLRAAREQGDVLVVGVNSDSSTRRLKGPGRPVVRDVERAEIVGANRCVDAVVVFEDDNPLRLLDLLRPDVHCKGSEYADQGSLLLDAQVVSAYGGRVVFLPMVHGRSTTALVKKAAAQGGPDARG